MLNNTYKNKTAITLRLGNDWLIDAQTIITRALLQLTIMLDAYLVDLYAQKMCCQLRKQLKKC